MTSTSSGSLGQVDFKIGMMLVRRLETRLLHLLASVSPCLSSLGQDEGTASYSWRTVHLLAPQPQNPFEHRGLHSVSDWLVTTPAEDASALDALLCTEAHKQAWRGQVGGWSCPYTRIHRGKGSTEAWVHGAFLAEHNAELLRSPSESMP